MLHSASLALKGLAQHSTSCALKGLVQGCGCVLISDSSLFETWQQSREPHCQMGVVVQGAVLWLGFCQ